MGKKLIIPGADFSENGIESVATKIEGYLRPSVKQKSVILSTQFLFGDVIEVSFKMGDVSKLTNNPVIMTTGNTSKYAIVTRPSVFLKTNENSIGGSYGGYRNNTSRNTVVTDGEYVCSVDTDYLIVNNNKLDIKGTTGTVNTDNYDSYRLFDDFIDVDADTYGINYVKVYRNNYIVHSFVAAKDKQNVYCFWDECTDVLYYINDATLLIL